MDIWTALRTIGRHWLVLLLGLALTLAVLVVLDTRVQQRYSATGTVVVISPGGNTNPIDVYSSSSSLAANVATTLGNDDSSKAAVAAHGGTSDYSLVTDPSLPVITITTTSPDPLTAVRSFGLVSQEINQLLRERQQAFSSPPATTLEVLAVTSPTSAKVTSYKLTVLLIAAMLGGLLAISFTFIADSVARRPVRRPGAPEEQTADAAAEPAVATAAEAAPDKGLIPARESRPNAAQPGGSQHVGAEAAASVEQQGATTDSARAAVPTSGQKLSDPDEPPTFQLPVDMLGGRQPLSVPTYKEAMSAPTSNPEQADLEPRARKNGSPARAQSTTGRRHPPPPR